MKNSLRAFMAVAVASVGLLAASPVEALPTGDITVTVTIRQLSLSLSAAAVDFDAIDSVIDAGDVVLTTVNEEITVTNNGNVLEDFSLLLTLGGTSWTAGTTPGDERFSLSGLFVESTDVPADGDFNVEDVILTTVATATATVFGEPTLAGTADGDDVADGTSVDLWFRLATPDPTTVTGTQTITVTVGAEPA